MVNACFELVMRTDLTPTDFNFDQSNRCLLTNQFAGFSSCGGQARGGAARAGTRPRTKLSWRAWLPETSAYLIRMVCHVGFQYVLFSPCFCSFMDCARRYPSTIPPPDAQLEATASVLCEKVPDVRAMAELPQMTPPATRMLPLLCVYL